MSLNQKVHHSSQDITKVHNGECDSDRNGSVIFLNQCPNSSKIATYTNAEQKHILFLSSGCSVVSNSFQPHGLQHTTHPCPSLSPGVCSIHAHWVSDVTQPSHPLLSPSPPAFIFPSIRVFSNESVLRIRWPKYWCFGLSISPSNEYLGFISFSID